MEDNLFDFRFRNSGRPTVGPESEKLMPRTNKDTPHISSTQRIIDFEGLLINNFEQSYPSIGRRSEKKRRKERAANQPAVTRHRNHIRLIGELVRRFEEDFVFVTGMHTRWNSVIPLRR